MERLDLKVPGVRWVRGTGMHLTLKFLGDIPEDLVSPLGQALDEEVASQSMLELRLRGLGAFPSRHRARVIWVGLAGDTERLKALAARIDQRCSSLGVAPEKRSFQAHITLGRRKVPSVVDLEEHVEDAAFTATEVHLVRSELLPAGARYTILHTSRFGESWV